jgi:hypothetical protein
LTTTTHVGLTYIGGYDVNYTSLPLSPITLHITHGIYNVHQPITNRSKTQRATNVYIVSSDYNLVVEDAVDSGGSLCLTYVGSRRFIFQCNHMYRYRERW